MDGMTPEEIGKVFLGERSDLIRKKSEELLNELMKGELEAFLESASLAPEGDFRNGYYSRVINTPYGAMKLSIPRDRLGEFRTRILEPYQRYTKNIGDVIQSLYVRGMTENEITGQVMDDFGVSVSRETVRKAVNRILGDAISFNTRAVPDCPIVFLDGTYVPIKRRYTDCSRVEKECVMVALGITREGRKQVLGFYFTPNEGSWAWDDVLKNLMLRGLRSPSLFVTDGLQGMPEAIRRAFPEAQHQLCLVHETRTICRDVRKSDRKEVAADFRKVYSSDCEEAARAELAAFREKWSRTYPAMARKLMAQGSLLTFMRFPKPLWKTVYTSNAIESFNAKLKRQTRRRILMNSESNAVITIAAVAAEYNRNACQIQIRCLSYMGEAERAGLFLPAAEK